MKRSAKNQSREVGLEIGSIFGKYFLKLEHLHYGYWPSDLEVDISNVRTAQENYVEFLISHIPEAVKTILDVGCGAGEVARELLSLGYQVDCVSPSPFFSEQAHELLGQRSTIFECRYEEVEIEKRYDLVLFSESFQYIGLEEALARTFRFLNNGGYMLICDIFRKDVVGKSLQRGGHKLNMFYDLTKKYRFELVRDVDITEETAPTIEILDDAVKMVGQPILRSGLRFLSGRYPIAFKLLRWRYRRQIKRINEKYLDGGRTAEDFKKFKSYRLLLYKKPLSL